MLLDVKVVDATVKAVATIKVAMIIVQHFKEEVFLPQALMDLLAGVVPFRILLWAVGRILVRWKIIPWISLLPGIFLVYYGFKLRKGRALWRRLELG